MDNTDLDDGDLSELDRLLNDPDVPMQASRIWELLDRVSSRNAGQPPK